MSNNPKSHRTEQIVQETENLVDHEEPIKESDLIRLKSIEKELQRGRKLNPITNKIQQNLWREAESHQRK